MLMGAAAGAAGVWALDRADWFMWKRENLNTRWRSIAVRPRHLPPAETLVSAIQEASGRDLVLPTFKAASAIVHYSIGIATELALNALERLAVRGER